MNSLDQFIGSNFAWFTGVVEDILDPKQMGRVRVRCLGYHSDNRSDIPTESLPWALVMLPITSASMSGVGQSATGILQGSWVIGFFRDGESAQDPVVLGSIPSISTIPDYTKGFSDPTWEQPSKAGVDTPVEARTEFKTADSYKNREALRVIDIVTAGDGTKWSSWVTADTVKPVYPSNNVVHTLAGHVIEIDDTPGAGRIFEMHSSGTHREIREDGDQSTTIKKDKFEVIIGNDHVYVKGTCNLTIDADCRTYVKGNYYLDIDGNKIERVKGYRETTVTQSEKVTVGTTFNLDVTAGMTTNAHAAKTDIIGGALSVAAGGSLTQSSAGATAMSAGTAMSVAGVSTSVSGTSTIVTGTTVAVTGTAVVISGPSVNIDIT